MRLEARRPLPLGDVMLGGPLVVTCVPIVAQDRDELLSQARHLAALRPDCVEWRADFYPDLTPDQVPALLADLRAALPRPLIFTYRRQEEGGHAPADENRRLAVYAAAAATGVPALLDLELAVPPAAAAPVVRAARQAGVGIIRSWHDFTGTPPAEAILDRLRSAQEAGADVAKVAVMAHTPEDVLRLLQASLQARRTFLEIPCVALSMGTVGSITRLAGGYFGSDMTFAVGQRASAPGQLDLGLVRRNLAALGLGSALGE